MPEVGIVATGDHEKHYVADAHDTVRDRERQCLFTEGFWNAQRDHE